jgi:hypothetical protein
VPLAQLRAPTSTSRALHCYSPSCGRRRSRFDPDYWLHTLLPNLQHTYLNLLMPLFLLQNAARVRRNTLEVLEVSDLGVLVRARLLSTELEWAPTSGEPIPY